MLLITRSFITWIYSMHNLAVALSVLATFFTQAQGLGNENAASLLLPTNLIHQFPNGTWVENLAVRTNGQLVTTISSTPDLYQVDPQNRCPPFLLHSFTGFTSTVGITETSPDIFQVVVGNCSLATFEGTPGSFSIFQVNVSALPACPDSRELQISEVAQLPNAVFLDGLTTLPQEPNTILAADINLGVVWRINVSNGESVVAIDNVLMKPGAVSDAIGIDGIKIDAGQLIFTNPGQNIIGKIPIDASGDATGNASIVVPIGGDDFAVDFGTQMLFSVGGSGNLTEVVLASGEALNLTMLPGPTACAFGRTGTDRGCLYVTTSGGDAAYAHMPVLVGGAVFSVDVFQNGSCAEA
ncbi:hypothetical protein F4802DRAFT_580178 [Xylaria palmicola]|nr:hypothetical protein F4802DRAFT_580178 [Xylaria palmicola]